MQLETMPTERPLYYGTTENTKASVVGHSEIVPTDQHGNYRTRIEEGDLAYYHTVRAGKIKVKVTGLHKPTFMDATWKVIVKVTARNNRWYDTGDEIITSPLNLSKRG